MRSILLRGAERRFRCYILDGSFERHCEKGFLWIMRAAWRIILVAVLFFGPICLNIFLR